jgi:succinate dehydrogenase / fumarate reductase iron-sulfur subunit
MAQAVLKVFRGDVKGGTFQEFLVPLDPGMVVLDALHYIQAHDATDLAVRWNCKAGKCGSCSAEVNGKPRLTCMTRMDQLPLDKPITVQPMQAFPVIKDLVTDVSWNYEVKRNVPPFQPRKPEADGTWRMHQYEIDRVQEFRKCIECYLCQNVCHVLRDHEKKQAFAGPRFLIHVAALEMHPLDTQDRTAFIKDGMGIGLCNITKCCTEVCPEHIAITDNAIIPLKERVVSAAYDPLAWLIRKVRRK